MVGKVAMILSLLICHIRILWSWCALISMFSLRIWRDLTALLHGIEMNLVVVFVVAGWRGQRWIWVDEPLMRWFPARVRERISEELGLKVEMQWW